MAASLRCPTSTGWLLRGGGGAWRHCLRRSTVRPNLQGIVTILSTSTSRLERDAAEAVGRASVEDRDRRERDGSVWRRESAGRRPTRAAGARTGRRGPARRPVRRGRRGKRRVGVEQQEVGGAPAAAAASASPRRWPWRSAVGPRPRPAGRERRGSSRAAATAASQRVPGARLRRVEHRHGRAVHGGRHERRGPGAGRAADHHEVAGGVAQAARPALAGQPGQAARVERTPPGPLAARPRHAARSSPVATSSAPSASARSRPGGGRS